VRVVQRQQARLDADSALEQQLAQLIDALLALIGRHELGQVGPSRHERVAALGIGLDVGRRAERYRGSGARGADGAQGGRAGLRLQGLSPIVVVRVQVHDERARRHGVAGLGRELRRRARQGRMIAVTVERGLEHYGSLGPPGVNWTPCRRSPGADASTVPSVSYRPGSSSAPDSTA
jgi:hypothetical protein